jgi:hypothetical protein
MDHLPKGEYVKIGGKLWPVTGKRQAEMAAAELARVGRRTAAIDHWNGREWSSTGSVLTSQ